MKSALLPVTVPEAPEPISVQIINLDHGMPHMLVQGSEAALEFQANHHVYPAWYGVIGNVHVRSRVAGDDFDADAWWIVVSPTAEYARDRGFLDRTPTGKPIGHIYTQSEEEIVSVALSRELCSMLVDPMMNTWVFSISRDCWAVDIGAPVRGITYECRKVPVADFVYPAFYDPFPSPDHDVTRPLDHTRDVEHRYQVMPNGYGVKIMGNGSVGVALGSRLDQDFGRGMLGSRRERRRRGHRNWEDTVVNLTS